MALRNMRVWQYVDEVARVGSVRKASQRLNVTPSAVLRRIQDIEYDLGAEIFERHNSGMLLTPAGEVLVHWIRSQTADLERVYSYIHELSGLRIGTIRIACSQALTQGWLQREILRFREAHPNIDFKVTVTNHSDAVQALTAYETDLVLIFRPDFHPDLDKIISIGQGLVAVMAADHPLASKPVVRLRDCALYEVALPDASFGAREMLDDFVAKSSAKFRIALESNSFSTLFSFVRETQAITFQVEIGAHALRSDPTIAVKPIKEADKVCGPLVLAKLAGRNLPHAVVKFSDQLARRLDGMRSLPMTG